MGKWYSIAEFADLTGRTRQTIWQQASKGRLKPYSRKVSGKIRIQAEALSLFEDREKPGTEQEPKPIEPEGIDKAGTDQERVQQEPGTDQEQPQQDQPGTSQDQPQQDQPGTDRDQLIGILLKEVETKNRQIEQLQQALQREQEALRIEQSIRTSLESRILTIEAHEAEKAENTARKPEEPSQGIPEHTEAATPKEEPEEPKKGVKWFFRRHRRR